ncbi:GntR family transcriptional regulator [Leucobacter soli]|uniref:GntR family transcriptional regulator n=1 Tax=Leucobacter soli TaxID=2812850 RepID=UPI00360673E2
MVAKQASSTAEGVGGSTGPDANDADGVLFTPPGSAALTRLSAVETVRARILLSIEHGLLAPGSRLPRLELIATGLEVSSITARRGLESLMDDGVLVRRPGRGGGTFVAETPPNCTTRPSRPTVPTSRPSAISSINECSWRARSRTRPPWSPHPSSATGWTS